jgi:hypothetical protein
MPLHLMLTSYANLCQHAAATVVLAYVLGLRESSAYISLRARRKLRTQRQTKLLVNAFSTRWQRRTATYAHSRTGVSYLPSRSDGSMARVRLAFRPDMQRSLHVLTRARVVHRNLSHRTDALGILDDVCNISFGVTAIMV